MTDIFRGITGKPDDQQQQQETATGEEQDNEHIDNEYGAINQLIYHSFFPASCMVPLKEDILKISNIPEMMKEKSNDSILQETIKTFHSLMQEKDDEILNLKKQLQDNNKNDKSQGKYVSTESQTMLTLEACQTMERQFEELSKDIPQKKVKIAELRKEKETLKSQMSEIRDSVRRGKSIQKKEEFESKRSSMSNENLQDDLEQAYKELESLELANEVLSKENKDLKTQFQELKWQYEELEDLKKEVELAKIIREEEMRQLTDVLVAKEKQLVELKSTNTQNSIVTNKNPENFLLAQTLSNKPELNITQTMSNSDVLYKLVDESLNENGAKLQTSNYLAVLNSIKFDKNGQMKPEEINKQYDIKRKEIEKLTKDDIFKKSNQQGYEIICQEFYSKQILDNLIDEYIELELILNKLNPNYIKSALSKIKQYSKSELIEQIILRKRTLFEISLHEFWLIEKSTTIRYHTTINFNKNNYNNICDNILMDINSKEQISKLLTNLYNAKSILLNGTKDVITKSSEQSMIEMKLEAHYLIYDLNCHIIPTYPKETRSRLYQESTEETVYTISKLSDKLSQDFINDLIKIPHFHKLTDYPSKFAEIILNIINIIDFEEELFTVDDSFINFTSFNCTSLIYEPTKSKPTLKTTKLKLKPNQKALIQEKIEQIVSLLNENHSDIKNKSETDLIKFLIMKKEKLMLKMFNETSNFPLLETIKPIKSNSVFVSLIQSNERLQLIDFSLKLINEKYLNQIIKDFEDYHLDELKTSLERLQQIEDIFNITSTIYPDVTDKQAQINQISVQISKIRIKLRHKLTNLLSYKSQINSDFKIPENVNSNIEKLDNLLKRLYEIDSVIYSDGSLSKLEDDVINHRFDKEFTKLTNSEISNEITSIRLVLLYYSSIYFFKNSHHLNSARIINSNNITDNDSLKQIKSTIVKINPKLLTDKYQKLEIEEWIEIKNNLQLLQDDEINEIYKEFNGNNPDDFIKEKKQTKIEMIQCEIDKIIPKTEEIAVDTTTSNTTNKLIIDKVIDVLKLIRDKEFKTKKSISANDTVNYLCEIESYIVENKKWRQQYQVKLTNTIKKLNTKTDLDKKLTQNMDYNDINDNCDLDKQVFEKSFAELERKINELNTDKVDNGKLADKTEEELKKIILYTEKEIGKDKWTNESELEAKEWLDKRSKSELLSDCQSCLNKVMIMRIDEILMNKRPIINGGTVKKSTSKSKQQKGDAKVTKFENDLEKKLAKYQELCDVVDGLKVPQNTYKKTKRAESPEPLRSTQIDFNYDEVPREHLTIPQRRSNMNSSPQAGYISEPEDEYFRNRVKELQDLIRGSSENPSKFVVSDNSDCFATYSKIKKSKYNKDMYGNDVIVDGFEIEDEKSSRYYSMRLQDMQHQRKEDELNAVLHHMEKHQENLVDENKSLKQKLYVSQNLIDSLQSRMELLENTERMMRDKSNNPTQNDAQVTFLQEQQQKLRKSLNVAENRMDEQNKEINNLTAANNSIKHEHHNLLIRHQHLERSLKKLEETYLDMLHQLEQEKALTKSLQSARPEPAPRSSKHEKSKLNHENLTELESKLRKSEREKVELVKKLDIIEQQNQLLKDHAEKLDHELMKSYKQNGEMNSKVNLLKNDLENLSIQLDEERQKNSKLKSQIQHAQATGPEIEENKRLKSHIYELETQLATMQEAPSQARLREELLLQRDKEIMKLRQELGTSRDLLEEAKAQLDVKDYENRKLIKANRQMQNQLNDSSYFPPPGYKLVREN